MPKTYQLPPLLDIDTKLWKKTKNLLQALMTLQCNGGYGLHQSVMAQVISVYKHALNFQLNMNITGLRQFNLPGYYSDKLPRIGRNQLLIFCCTKCTWEDILARYFKHAVLDNFMSQNELTRVSIGTIMSVLCLMMSSINRRT